MLNFHGDGIKIRGHYKSIHCILSKIEKCVLQEMDEAAATGNPSQAISAINSIPIGVPERFVEQFLFKLRAMVGQHQICIPNLFEVLLELKHKYSINKPVLSKRQRE